MALALLATPLLAGCLPPPEVGGSASGPGSDAPAVAAVRDQLEALPPVPPEPPVAYDRRQHFGPPWLDVDRNGCGTRDDVLARDLTGVQRRDRCVVVAGELVDPYTGDQTRFRKSEADEVQVDHVVPLALAWRSGAWQWSQGRRVAFANDPLNLLAVEGKVNQAKSDSGPAEWLPREAYRCAYAARFVRVLAAYGVGVGDADRAALGAELDGCAEGAGERAAADALALAPLPPEAWAAAERAGGGVPAGPAPPAPAGRSSEPEPAPAGSACPPAAPIKGNDSSSGELIYHSPGQQAYEVTVPERCFPSGAEAERAGYRAARR